MDTEKTYELLFSKYINKEVSNELQILYNNLEKKVILTNIKYDLQRRNILLQIIRVCLGTNYQNY